MQSERDSNPTGWGRLPDMSLHVGLDVDDCSIKSLASRLANNIAAMQRNLAGFVRPNNVGLSFVWFPKPGPTKRRHSKQNVRRAAS
eukprot:1110804-Rhodomonas_salina.1